MYTDYVTYAFILVYTSARQVYIMLLPELTHVVQSYTKFLGDLNYIRKTNVLLREKILNKSYSFLKDIVLSWSYNSSKRNWRNNVTEDPGPFDTLHHWKVFHCPAKDAFIFLVQKMSIIIAKFSANLLWDSATLRSVPPCGPKQWYSQGTHSPSMSRRYVLHTRTQIFCWVEVMQSGFFLTLPSQKKSLK